MDCHFLLQGIFLTRGTNPGLLHRLADSLPLSHLGSPSCLLRRYNSTHLTSLTRDKKVLSLYTLRVRILTCHRPTSCGLVPKACNLCVLLEHRESSGTGRVLTVLLLWPSHPVPRLPRVLVVVVKTPFSVPQLHVLVMATKSHFISGLRILWIQLDLRCTCLRLHMFCLVAILLLLLLLLSSSGTNGGGRLTRLTWICLPMSKVMMNST